MISRVGVGIIGFGTVGTGVVKILLENASLISRRIPASNCASVKYVTSVRPSMMIATLGWFTRNSQCTGVSPGSHTLGSIQIE